MEKAHRQTIEAMAVAINAKDEVTARHVRRVQITRRGGRLLGCDAAEVEALRAGRCCTTSGKIAVPDYILNKPGKLTAAEFDKMKLHTVAGAQILSRVEFPYPVVPVVRHHHERFDGKGYPDGLKGEDIPLTARILSVVDCFDAVREDRQYRKGMTREEAIELLRGGASTTTRASSAFITHCPSSRPSYRRTDGTPEGIRHRAVEQLSEAAAKVARPEGLAERGGRRRASAALGMGKELGGSTWRARSRAREGESSRLRRGAGRARAHTSSAADAVGERRGREPRSRRGGPHAGCSGPRRRARRGRTGWVSTTARRSLTPTPDSTSADFATTSPTTHARRRPLDCGEKFTAPSPSTRGRRRHRPSNRYATKAACWRPRRLHLGDAGTPPRPPRGRGSDALESLHPTRKAK